MSSVCVCINGKPTIVQYNSDITSKLIKDLLVDINNSNCANRDVDPIVIPIPDVYQFAFDNYISIVIGDNKLSPIGDINLLIQCLTLSNYLEDDIYFDYCLEQLFGNWTKFRHIIYNDMINYDLKYKILSYCPYDFLPQQFRDNTTFINAWLERNQDVVIGIDQLSTNVHDSKVYYINMLAVTNNSNGSKELINYYELDGTRQETSFEYVWYDQVDRNEHNDNDEDNKYDVSHLINLYINTEMFETRGGKQGLWKQWYTNGKLYTKGYYDNNKRTGLHLTWNYDGKLESRCYYNNNCKHGLYEEWHGGSFFTKGYYENGKRYGSWITWYNNKNILCQGQYEQDEKHGSWEEYNSNGNLKETQLFNHGKQVFHT